MPTLVVVWSLLELLYMLAVPFIMPFKLQQLQVNISEEYSNDNDSLFLTSIPEKKTNLGKSNRERQILVG